MLAQYAFANATGHFVDQDVVVREPQIRAGSLPALAGVGLYYEEVADFASALLPHPLQPLRDFSADLAVPLAELLVLGQVLPLRPARSQAHIRAGAHLEMRVGFQGEGSEPASTLAGG